MRFDYEISIFLDILNYTFVNDLSFFILMKVHDNFTL